MEREDLDDLLRRRWLLVGVGNEMRGDDAFGPLLAQRLAAAGLPAIDAATAPENTTGTIRRAAPEVLLLADAAHLGEPLGTVRLLPPGALADGATSTHDPSLGLMVRFLGAELDLEVRVLAAQPGGRGFGDEPSPELLAAVDRTARMFLSAGGPLDEDR